MAKLTEVFAWRNRVKFFKCRTEILRVSKAALFGNFIYAVIYYLVSDLMSAKISEDSGLYALYSIDFCCCFVQHIPKAEYVEFLFQRSSEKLPDKWNTRIGENGCELSGGERQRISIACAFLKDAPIILLDEVTASLDVENKTMIQSAISKLMENKTVMVIAHRMRTVVGADKVVVLADGEVAEQGTPNELRDKDRIYRRMSELQNKNRNYI